MALFLAPIINDQQENANGAPLSGGTIEVYLAGTSTPSTTYSDQAGANPNTWPIVLNTLGVNNQGPVWLTGGFSYKFVIKDSVGVVQRTIDNVTGINDNTSTNDQWIPFTTPPTYVSATSFTVAGDQRQIFQIGRRVRTTNTGGTIFSTITGVAYLAPNTTVTVRNDSGVIDSGLSAVSYGLISPLQTSFPGGTINYGQCRMSVSGGNVILQPYNGNRITINGSICLIPAAGVTLAPTALAPGTSYFIYAYMDAASGALTLEASTTAHATDVTTGVEIKSGDSTRTLVGMARPIVGPAWANTDIQRLVISWFNRRGLRLIRQAVGAPGTGSLTPVGIIAAIEMLCWGDSPVTMQFTGAVANNTVNQICQTALGFDSPTAFSHGTTTYQAYAVSAQGAAVGGSTFAAAEGFHSVLTLGAVTGGVGTWQAGFEMSGVTQG